MKEMNNYKAGQLIDPVESQNQNQDFWLPIQCCFQAALNSSNPGRASLVLTALSLRGDDHLL